MPLFFFHYWDGETLHHDETGLDLSSAEEALCQAAAAARAMMPELIAERVTVNSCAFEISSGEGTGLFRLEFAELLGSERRPPAPDPSPLHRELVDTHQRAQKARSAVRDLVLEARESLSEALSLLERFDAIARRPTASAAQAETPSST